MTKVVKKMRLIPGKRPVSMYKSLIDSVVVQIYPETPTLALPSRLRVSTVPVTRAQYKRILIEVPGLPHPATIGHAWTWAPNSGRLPATGVSCLEAESWIAALNDWEGRPDSRRWRLPAEGNEWDMICRAGRGGSGHDWWTAADMAREASFASDQIGIPPVQTRQPSPAGLYDLWTMQTWAQRDEQDLRTRKGEAPYLGRLNWQHDRPRDGSCSGGPGWVSEREQSPIIGLRLVCDDTEPVGGLSLRDWDDYHYSDNPKFLIRNREEIARFREGGE